MFLNLDLPVIERKIHMDLSNSESPFGKCMYALFGYCILLAHRSESLMVILLLSPTLTGLVLNVVLSFII